MGLLQATATNVIGMVGVGPFLTIPFMVSAMNGPHLIYAWAFGAVLALCDGLVYAELGAALPGSGGPYLYLREAYRPFGLGRLLSFVFIFQVVLVAPLSIAGGAVGFADYLGFYWTTMSPAAHNMIAAGVCVAMTALLYRQIESVGRLAVIMLAVVLLTVGWVIVAGLIHFSWAQAFDFPPAAYRLDAGLIRAIGAGGLLAMYNYGGYTNVCYLGDEIRRPERTMPRAIVLSIVVVVMLYVVMSTVMLGVIPWREAQQSHTIADTVVHEVFWLQIAMHDALAMRRIDRSGDLTHDARDLLARERTGTLGDFLQQLTRSPLDRQILQAISRADLDRAHDIRMHDSKAELRLAFKITEATGNS